MIRIHKNRTFQYTIMFIAVSFLIVIPNWKRKITDKPQPNFFAGDTIVCNVLVDSSKISKEYTLNYLYEFFNKFKQDQDAIIELSPQKNNVDQWAMLNEGKIDMLVINSQKDSVPEEYQQNLISSIPIHKDDIVCVVKKDDYSLVQTINYWLNSFKHTKEYIKFVSKYFNKYRKQNLFIQTAGSYKISPYDKLIKEAAATIGWDWRLLASLICQESRFRANVSSSQGAIGLMQIKAIIGKQFGVTNIYEPHGNIKAGTAYIKRLQNIYKNKGADSTNTIKLVLAAYNSGHGRIDDCMTVATKEKLNPLIWDNLVSIIPLLNEDEYCQKAQLKFGRFKGKETINFVENIISRYQEYKKSVSID